MRFADVIAVIARGERPRRRPGFNEPNRKITGSRRGRHTATGQHDEKIVTISFAMECRFQLRQIRFDQRLSIGVRDRRRSTFVLAEFREYERTSTTVANAYTQPLVKAYLAELETTLHGEGYRDDLFVMLSSGGVTPATTAGDFPVRLVESGPAAGALATGYYGNHVGEPHLLSFDMGGTTAKVCVIDNGVPTRTKYFEVARVERFIKGSGLPVRSPVIDMIEIGAGGGSIAFID